MKKAWFFILLPVLVLGISFLSIAGGNNQTLVSPYTHKSVLGLNQWFPLNLDSLPGGEGLEITASAALFVETTTGRVLYSKNPFDKVPVASLVKVMTAIIALENRDLEDTFLVSETAASVEPDKMWLKPGEEFTLKELLYGIFLISANDAAEVLAEETLENRQEFLTQMNSKAKQLGMNDTLFVNPTGLDEDSSSSYSTAYDLVLLSRYAIKRHPSILEISQTPHVFWEEREDRQSYDMYSGINLLTTYPGVVGLKTGYTPSAGLTLITLAKKDGYEVLGVILGSQNRREEAKELLDYSFKKLKVILYVVS